MYNRVKPLVGILSKARKRLEWLCLFCFIVNGRCRECSFIRREKHCYKMEAEVEMFEEKLMEPIGDNWKKSINNG